MTTNDKAHWERVHQSNRPDQVSWFQNRPTISLDLIMGAAPTRDDAIIDVGGGSSTLVDGLLQAGYSHLTVLDLSSVALERARARLETQESRVTWLEADVLSADLGTAAFDVWHDRAVFHFLESAEDRTKYQAQVRRAVKPGGYVLVATFAEDGPTMCSGLPVSRYSANTLHAEFGAGFSLVRSLREQHVTPAGRTQSFVYCLCRYQPPARTRTAA